MTEAEVKAVIKEFLEEQNKTQDDLVLKTIATILTSFGIDEEDRKEVRADFIHLRKWRKSVEQAQSLTFKVVVTALLTGFVGAVWMGIKTMLGK